ncbi:MAG: ORF6N domain-containing protein [Chitinophagaceae bacterium]|nr:ORF6N domain-containing protein [Chitinophagaceae bacterium]
MKGELAKKEITETTIIERIHVIRGIKVMLDNDLAEMYGVPTHRLNEAVKRNLSRFPEDFMFQLDIDEFEILISQIAISRFHEDKKNWGGRRKPPYAFTEQGVAMLSSVLRSETAIQVNIQIIRVYTKMRQLLINNKDLWIKLEKIEKDIVKKDDEIKVVFKILKQLLVQDTKPREPIGFKLPKKKSS